MVEARWETASENDVLMIQEIVVVCMIDLTILKGRLFPEEDLRIEMVLWETFMNLGKHSNVENGIQTN